MKGCLRNVEIDISFFFFQSTISDFNVDCLYLRLLAINLTQDFVFQNIFFYTVKLKTYLLSKSSMDGCSYYVLKVGEICLSKYK